MTADQLQAFCSAARFKNVTAAAAALGTSQPALSRQLANLQTALGERLYERTAFGIDLTPAGEAFLPYACAVAQTLEQARYYAKDKGSRLRLTLTVGLSHSLVPSHTPRLLAAGAKRLAVPREVRLQLVEGYGEDLVARVLTRELDAALVIEPGAALSAPLISQRYSEDLLGLLVPLEHPLAGTAMTSIISVQGETLILPAPISSVHTYMQTCLARSRVSPKRTLVVSGPAGVAAAVRSGNGLGVTVSSYVRGSQQHNLAFVQLEEPNTTLGLYRITHDLTTLEQGKRDLLELFSR